jgi:hypothetical protein
VLLAVEKTPPEELSATEYARNEAKAWRTRGFGHGEIAIVREESPCAKRLGERLAYSPQSVSSAQEELQEAGLCDCAAPDE